MGGALHSKDRAKLNHQERKSTNPRPAKSRTPFPPAQEPHGEVRIIVGNGVTLVPRANEPSDKKP